MSNIVDLKFKEVDTVYENKIFKHKSIPYIQNDRMINYHFIVLENTETFEIENTIFTDFVLQKKNRNLDDNTKRNICSHISMLLNYTLINNETRLTSIEELDIDYLDDFINDYDKGVIGKSKEPKTKKTVIKVERTLTEFIYWLFNNKNFSMNNFKEEDFIKTTSKNGSNNREYLESIFTLYYNGKRAKEKLKSSNLYICLNLIEVSKQYDPMLTFGMILQMFTGMRIGEVCQMTFDRVKIIEDDELIRFFKINLLEDKLLRSDGVVTGSIKRFRKQIIYPAYYKYVFQSYTSHKKYIESLNLDIHTYEAMFINEDGVAMTDKNYTQRLNRLLPKLNERLYILAELGYKEAKIAHDILQEGKITSHTFRYFYSQMIGSKIGKNPYTLAMYRGDDNIKSAMRYIKEDINVREDIAIIQDEFEKDVSRAYSNMIIPT